MTFKTCKVINDHFLLDENFAPYLLNRKGTKIPVEEGIEKGYIYASLYFYDEVQKEVKKLEKMIRKIHEEVLLESPNIDPAILMVEMSRRVKDSIGDDSLDALIKEVLAEKSKHISLLPDEKETEKFEKIQDSILTEIIATFYKTTIEQSTDEGALKTVTLTQKYIESLSVRQKKLVSPAMRMVAFLNDIKLDKFKITPEFKATFKIEKLKKPFEGEELAVKDSLKQLMAQHA